MDCLTPFHRSRNMKAIRFKGTKIEVRLAKALWAVTALFETSS